MKLFLDENIPHEDAGKLLLIFPGSIYAREDKRFRGRSDGEIYDFLREKSYVLVSNDSDFSNKLRFPPEPTGGIIVLRTKGMRKATAYRKLLLFLSPRRPQDLRGSLTIITKAKIRTRTWRN